MTNENYMESNNNQASLTETSNSQIENINKEVLIKEKVVDIVAEISKNFDVETDEGRDKFKKHIASSMPEIKEEATKKVEYILCEKKAESMMDTKQKISSKIREIILKIFPSLSN